MEDYPRTLLALEERFPTEEACRAYLVSLRWPEGFICPGCAGRQGWQMERGLWLCAHCRRQTSPMAGTIFQDTKVPLRAWFRSQKNGASAMNIQRTLGFGSYKTAWSMLHKLRRAMVRPGRDRLSGRIEVDETYIGGEEEGVHGRETEAKALVAIAAQEDGNSIGRIRLRRIADASAASLHGFITDSIETGSTIRTDGWGGYEGVKQLGYKHEIRVLAHHGKDAAVKHLPRVHRVAALVKRWLMGTHQGAVRINHLDYYLDEYTFRFNRRASASRGKLFYRLVQQAAQVEPRPYRTLVHPQRVGGG